MADLFVIFSPDKKSAAGQVAEASRAAGYEAELVELAEPDGGALIARARSAPAALLVWSRPLVASAMLDGWLAALRQLPSVIEVSTDGIAPDTGEAGRVVLLSGWRGQPHHLGWQKILDELKRLRAPRSAETAPRPPATGAEEERKAPVRPADAASAGKARRIALPVLALAAVAAAAGALTWSGSRAPDPEPVRPNQTAAIRPAPERAPPAVVRPAPAAPADPLPGVAPLAAPAAAPQERSLAQSSRRQAAKSGPPRRRVLAEAPASGPVKRYSKRNSKTMRLFCARSGRSTPQCRTFLRSTRAGS